LLDDREGGDFSGVFTLRQAHCFNSRLAARRPLCELFGSL
jgi:hypothetical protein